MHISACLSLQRAATYVALAYVRTAANWHARQHYILQDCAFTDHALTTPQAMSNVSSTPQISISF